MLLRRKERLAGGGSCWAKRYGFGEVGGKTKGASYGLLEHPDLVCLKFVEELKTRNLCFFIGGLYFFFDPWPFWRLGVKKKTSTGQ